MKETLTNNLVIKLLSIPLAAIIWIIIINIDDPATTRTLSNIPIEFLNEDAIASLDKVYDVEEGNTVTVSVKGKRSVLDRIKYTDIHVTADLTQMTPFNKIELVASCPKFDYVNLEFSTKPKMLTVNLEDKETKQVKINVEQIGEAASGFSVGSVESKPNLMEVSGAKSVVRKIAEARVSVDINNASESFKEENLIPKVYDEDGKEVDSSRLKFSSSSVSVKVNIQRTKTVPIEVTTEGTVGNGYEIMKVEFEPGQIEISGTDNVLKEISSIPITIDVSNAKGNIEKEIDLLKEYLPNGVVIVGNMTSIAVKITIDKLYTKEITFTANDIKPKNVPDGLEFNYSDSNKIYKVKVMGDEDIVGKLTVSQMGAYVDLNGLGEGKHVVTVKFEESSSYVVVSSPTVSVKLTSEKGKEDDQPTATKEPEPTKKPEDNQDEIRPNETATPDVDDNTAEPDEEEAEEEEDGTEEE